MCDPKSQEDRPSRLLKKARLTVNIQAITLLIDRTNVSNRKAAFILQVAAHSYGQKVSEMSLSISSINRSRSKHRFIAAAIVKATPISQDLLVVHFDGKLFPSITGGPQKEDRVVELVTGCKAEKILAISKVTKESRELITNAASESLQEWDLVENIAEMSFDTTAANTGHLNGACVLLEQKLRKSLLWLPCRHHVWEAVCGNVFKKLSRPNVTLFRFFQEFWPNIGQGLSNHMVTRSLHIV